MRGGCYARRLQQRVAIVSAGTTGFNPPQAQTLPTGSAIARKSGGGGQLRYHSIRPSSVTERVIHSFGAGRDGYDPQAALLNVNGTFYGTTVLSRSRHQRMWNGVQDQLLAKRRVLHTFDSTDGAYPVAKLINVNGTLYGTAYDGGANVSDGYGTVFSITQSGKLTTIHNFAGYPNDGSQPVGALTNVNGTLYGTTSEGGTYGNGTVFSITTTGHETVLHSFGSGSDGDGPMAGLININGTLYGTTDDGGAGCDSWMRDRVLGDHVWQ